jgi:hypothetical protein
MMAKIVHVQPRVITMTFNEWELMRLLNGLQYIRPDKSAAGGLYERHHLLERDMYKAVHET